MVTTMCKAAMVVSCTRIIITDHSQQGMISEEPRSDGGSFEHLSRFSRQCQQLSQHCPPLRVGKKMRCNLQLFIHAMPLHQLAQCPRRKFSRSWLLRLVPPPPPLSLSLSLSLLPPFPMDTPFNHSPSCQGLPPMAQLFCVPLKPSTQPQDAPLNRVSSAHLA